MGTHEHEITGTPVSPIFAPTAPRPTAPTAASGMAQQLLFWGCFLALITTAFGFIARMFLINTWAAEFNLDAPQAGRLAGIGIWPFAASIIGFSLVIDKIGYKVSMMIAFLGHLTWAVVGVAAYFVLHAVDKDGNVNKIAALVPAGVDKKQLAYNLLYWGSLVLALANGTVEAFINPVVATMFSKDKTKWLNILHAGWPGGLVVAGMVIIFIDHVPWWIKVGLIAIPAVIYFLILIGLHFPAQERVSAGVSYREMLGEFGGLGALIVGFLVALQLMDFFKPADGQLSPTMKYVFIGIGAVIVLGFAAYTRSFGRPLLFFLVLIMIPLATTEIGTDGWITGIMENITKDKFHPGWILVFTSVIMMILRFFAGPIVHKLTPLGLLAVSAFLAIGGLAALSISQTLFFIFLAAFLYGLGKTFFWPTMLGVVAEQTPKGGALTLNAISGIGMLAVGTLGFPYIGTLQADKQIAAVAESRKASEAIPGFVENGKVSEDWLEKRDIYEVLNYKVINEKKLDEEAAKLVAPEKDKATKEVEEEAAKENRKLDDKEKDRLVAEEMKKRADHAKKPIQQVLDESKQGALLNMAVFPAIMLAGYLCLLLYFKAKGGYKPIHLGDGH
jgi:MFS family permease